MSTHNIGFYEEISKVIFELSSNIIKYAPYFFCCSCLTGSSPARLAQLVECLHGVQRRMISVDNFFRIFDMIIFCLVVAI